MGKGSAPKPPDPQKTAQAQTGTNIGTAVANGYLQNVNQVTPYGNLTFSQTGTNNWQDPTSGANYALPQMTATQSFTPQGQRINDANMGAQINMAELARDQSGRLRDALGTEFSTDGLPSAGRVPNLRGNIHDTRKVTELGRGPSLQENIAGAGDITKTYGTDFSEDRQRVEDALMQRMQGGLQRDKGALEDRLASQGIQMGSAAYRAAMDDYGRQTNDARLGAILAGGQEQSRMVGLEAGRAGFENAAQGQQFAQNAAEAQFLNSTRQQGYDNKATRAGFNNGVQQQRFNQNAQKAAFANTAAQQQYQLQQGARDSAMQERFALRSQPINEIAALLGGSQVQQPNFINAQGPQAATTDYAGIVNNNYAQQMAGYNARQQSLGGLMGGLGSLGGAWIGMGG